MSSRRRFGTVRAALPLLAALALSACSGSPDTEFLTLDSRPSTVSASTIYDGPPIQVGSVRIPADLDRSELIRHAGPNVMKIDDFARWAAPLDALVQRALTQDLASRLPAGSLIYPAAPITPASKTLTVDMLDFEIKDGMGTMEVSWTLVAPNAAASPGPGAPLSLTVPVSGAGAQASADALSRLVAALADDIANRLSRKP